jgi:hypothetical protein
MPHTLHSFATRITHGLALRTSSFLYTTFGVSHYDQDSVPLLAPPICNVHDTDEFAMSATTDGEEDARNLRQSQQNSWSQECEERNASLNMLRTFSASGQNQVAMKARRNVIALSSPVHGISTSQQARLHEVHDSRNTTHSMYEQQTGIIRDHQPAIPETHSSKLSLHCHSAIKQTTSPFAILRDNNNTDCAQECAKEGSLCNKSSLGSPLRSRRAVKRKANPLFARPVAQDFQRAGDVVDDLMEWKYLFLNFEDRF